jgi:hypothetical protein
VADNRIEFRYDIADVTSAQRMRFLNSPQLKLLIAFWAITVLFLALSIYFPQTISIVQGVTWAVIGQISLIYVVTLVGMIFVVPWLSFNFNRFWKLPLVFQFNQKNLRLSVAGKQGGLRLAWDEVRRVEGNDRVYLVYYDDTQKHFILPRSAFKPHQDKRFQDYLARYTRAGRDAAKNSDKPTPVSADSDQDDDFSVDSAELPEDQTKA